MSEHPDASASAPAPAGEAATIVVRDLPERRRYVAMVDDQVAGFVVYALDGTTIDFLHTQVDEAFGGLGVGSAVAKGALEDARDRGLRVDPTCPFIASYLGRHPEYASLVGD